MHKNKGITIVALVITIILLIILAGVSIQELTGNGIFQKAIDAKEKAKLAELEERMNLKITEMIATKNGGKIEVKDFIEQLTEKEKMDITERYDQIIVIEDKYVFEVIDEDPYISVNKVGIKDKLPPRLTLSSITDTTNSITVKLIAKRNEGGKIEYYIKSEDEDKYVLKETQTDETYKYTYTQLEQNKTYNIKIVAIAKNGQTDEILVDRTLGSVPNLTERDITFTYTVDGEEIDKETWTNKKVTVTASTTIEGYTLQTSTDGKEWSNETSQTFTGNGKIYAVLYDGKNYGGSAAANVINIDTLAPKDFTPTATSTTKSITVTAITEDAEATETSAKSGIEGYRFKLDSGSWTEYQTSGTYTWDDLAQTTNHTITVEAKDNAGNTTTKTVDKGTDTIPDLAQGGITFTYTVDGEEINKETWTNKKVTVTASTTIEGYTLQTSTDGVTWSNATSQTFTGNGKIYAVLYDGKNYGGSATGNVTNIDTLAPKDFTPTATSTTKSITVTASTEDAEATETSGKSGMAGYRFKLDSGSWTEYQTSGTYTWDDLAQTTNHTITVEAKDNAGNTTTKTVDKGTDTIPDLAQGGITFTYTVDGQEINKETWTNKKVTVTASTTIEGYTLQTSKDGATWSNETSQTFTGNGKMYAVLYDGKNYGVSATANVTNIDTTAPTISTALSSTSAGINSISLSVGITDTNSGLGKVEWYYGTTNNPTTLAGRMTVTNLNGTVTGPTTAQTKTYTVSGLSVATTYYFKVIVYDVAGNPTTSSVISATTNNPTAGDISYTPSDTSWNVENVQGALDSLYSR